MMIYDFINLKNNLKYYAIVWPGFAALIAFGAVLYFLLFPSTFDGNMGYATAKTWQERILPHYCIERLFLCSGKQNYFMWNRSV